MEEEIAIIQTTLKALDEEFDVVQEKKALRKIGVELRRLREENERLKRKLEKQNG